MGRATDGAVLRGLRVVFDGGSVAGLADGPLLERFARRGEGEGDSSAFAVLVERHGPMVWRVCRATLRDEHEAEDAFQAVFLVLARKARSLWVRDSLGPWLHAVALRTAAFARSEAKRRLDLERRRAASIAPWFEGPPRDDPSPVIHEELGKLPDRYRTAVVLCDLEGLSHEEAARQLGWPIGTVKSRQSRGRARLRERLIRRGFGPSAGALIFPASSLPPALAPTAVDAATAFLRDGVVSSTSPAALLMQGVLMAMRFHRVQARAAVVVIVGAVASTAALSARAVARPDDPPAKPAAAPVKPAPRPIRDVLRDASRSTDPKDAFGLASFALAQARVGDRDGARETARKASAAAEAMKGLEPQTEAILLLAVAWARHAAGDSSEGLKNLARAGLAVDRIEDINRRLNNRRSLAIALADLGDPGAAAEAVKTLERDVSSAAKRPPPYSGEFSHSIAATNLIRAQVATGDIEGAFRTVDGFSDAYKGRLLGVIAATAATPNHSRNQPQRRLNPEERKARLATVTRVEKAIEGIDLAELRPDTDLAIALAELEEFDEALRVARRFGTGPIRSPNSIDLTSTPYILSVIASFQCQAGRKEEARATLREAFALIEHDAKLIRYRGGQVAGHQVDAGDVAGALKTIGLMHNVECPRLLARAAVVQAESGDVEGSRATFGRALREADEFFRNPPTIDAVRTSVTGRQQQIDPAEREKRSLTREAQTPPAEREKRSLERKENTLADITAIQAASGDLDGATTSLGKITLPTSKKLAVREIAEARTRAGDPDGALRWALSLEPTLRSVALGGLAWAVIRP